MKKTKTEKDFFAARIESKADAQFVVVPPKDWEERRFIVAASILPEMVREAFEEGLDMEDAVDDTIRYADLLIKRLKCRK